MNLIPIYIYNTLNQIKYKVFLFFGQNNFSCLIMYKLKEESMIKKILYVLIVFIPLILLTGCQNSYNNIESFYNQMQLKKKSYNNMRYLLKVKIGDIKTQSLVSISNNKTRIESSLDNGKTYPTISIKNDDGAYMYIPNSKTAYETSQDIDSQLDVLEWGDYDFSHFSFGKRKKYNGEKCLEIINYTKNNEIYYCISEKYGIPIVSRISMGKDYNITTNVYNIKTSRISKKKFEIPKKAKIIRQAM